MLVEDQKKKINLARAIPGFQMFIVILTVLLIVYDVLTKTVLSGAALPLFLDMRLSVPGLDQDSHVSALIIGIAAAVVLFFYTIGSIGKQKKMRRMKTRPINQLVFTIIADILILVASVLYMRDGGFPMLGAYFLVAIIAFAAANGIPGNSKKEKA